MGLFGFGKRSFKFDCPMCQREYSLSFKPADIDSYDYLYEGEKHSVLTKQPCGFCKTEMTVLFSKSYEASAIDEKWGKYVRETEDKMDELDTKIADNEDEIDELLDPDCEEPDKEKQISALKLELPKLKAAYKKMETAFDKKQDTRMDRESRWEEKYENKYG